MLDRSLVAIAAAAGVCLTTPAAAPAADRGYASVNGLEVYYEIHGSGAPLVLLHGGLMTIEHFGELVPSLAETRRVIAIEQQGHGRTADVDRPLSTAQMAEDTAAVLRHLGIEHTDVFGYSMGGAVALQIAMRHPDLVRRLVVAAASYDSDGLHPEVLDGIRRLKPQDLAGSAWQEGYAAVAPDPENWSALVHKVSRMEFAHWSPDAIRTIQAPTLVVIGDADIVRPEHAVGMFRLLGGGVAGDLHGLPRSRLAVLPGTTHVTLLERAGWLTPMVTEFLDAPLPKAD